MVDVVVQFEYKAENDDELSVKVGDVITNVVQHDGGWWEGDLNGSRGMFPENFVKVRTNEVKKMTKNTPAVATHHSSTNSGASTVGGNGVTLRKEKKRRCKVLFSYKPVNEDELELEVNEEIEILEEVEEGWWKGCVKGKTGVFPSNFVLELEPLEVEVAVPPEAASEKPPQNHDGEIKPKPVKGVGYGNIFQDGMVKLKVTTQEPKTTEPPKGAVAAKKPLFTPTAAAAPQLPPKRVKEQARVLYAYEAQNDDELTLKENDVINVISKDIEDRGWWKGELAGRIGVFPDNFVSLIVAEEPRPRKPERPEKGPTLPQHQSKADSGVSNGPSQLDSSSAPAPQSYKERVSSLPRGGGSPKRLPPDVPKKDDAVADDKATAERPVPPLPSKKPNLLPPTKKMLRISSGFGGMAAAAASSSAATTTATTTTTTTIKKEPVTFHEPTSDDDDDNDNKSRVASSSPKQQQQDGEHDFDGIESASEKLVHLTANRAKNPNRRPPSHVFHRDGDKANGDIALENGENPWLREMKRNQAAKRSSLISHDSNNLCGGVVRDVIPEVPEEKTTTTTTACSGGGGTGSLKRGGGGGGGDKSEAKVLPPSTAPASHHGPATSALSTVKASTVTEVDSSSSSSSSKESKPSSSSVEVSGAGHHSSLSELAVAMTSLQEKLTNRLDELARQYSELSEAFEVHKILANNRIDELYGELQTEKKCRLMLQSQVDGLQKTSKK